MQAVAMKKSRKKKSPHSLLAKAERALREAVAGVIEDHRQAGTPLIVWRNGKVARVHPRQLAVGSARTRVE
jgi:hypothetical protein